MQKIDQQGSKQKKAYQKKKALKWIPWGMNETSF